MKHLKFFFIFAVLLTIGTTAYGQNVTVKPSNGNTIPAVKGSGDDDSFYNGGGFAMWKHNQLNLTMTTADADAGLAVSEKSGQFENPANNIFNGTNNLQLGRGRLSDCYVAFTLPKGYRFTKYTITFRRNINAPTNWTGTGNNASADGGSGNASFGEAAYGETGKTDWDWFDNSTDTHKTGLAYSTSAARQTITRTAMQNGDKYDMDNTLYFKLINDSRDRVFLNLESIEFEFTAEADYTPFTPAGGVLNRTAVDIPFSTSTVDIGTIAQNTYQNSTRISYRYNSVKDLVANLTLFEAESVEDGTNFDGTSGKVVKYADGGTITSNGDYFQIGRAGATEQQIYYIESPTYIRMINDPSIINPIGYRITGAEIKYTYGQARAARTETVTENVLVGTKTYPTFTISCDAETFTRSGRGTLLSPYTYTSNGTQTYYMTASAGMSTNESEKALWFIDDNGYIRSASSPNLYLKNKSISGTSNRMAVTDPTEDTPAKFAINASGQIALQANQNMYLCLNVTNYRNTSYAQTVNFFQMNNSGSTKATRTLTGETKSVDIYETQEKTINFPAFTPSPYTLYVYDNEGNELKHVKVNENTPDGSLTIPNMNNDAVKIGIIGVGLIEGSITMQALDPYIDRMSIVCQEAELKNGTYQRTDQGRDLTQTFTASDFTVSGAAFHFYMPTDFESPCLFTFENLHSAYGDNTYYGNEASKNNARYSFVKSPYWDNNANLYATSYDPSHPYTDKVKTLVKGTKAFTFNNAGSVGSSGGDYQEYPFTLSNYANQGGNFNQLFFTEAELDENATPTKKTAYLFTCDETRYNISTATATQHRTYAFYQMDITAQRATYFPAYEWTKIYDKTLYRDNQGNTKEDAQWGLKLKTTYSGEGTDKYGYLGVTQIVNGINSQLDTNGTNAPKSANQILYVDASELMAVVENSEKKTVDGQTTVISHKMGEINDILGANAVVFLPYGTTTDQDNYAYKNQSGKFDGAGNFVITDMNPFYTPFDISLASENKAVYERKITLANYDKVTSASIIMPFTITVNNEGKHINADETEWAFSLHNMQIDNALTHIDGKDCAYFPELPANVTKTVANKPYLVKVNTENFPADESISFIISQKGTTIKATSQLNNQGKPVWENSDYTFTGEKASGTLADGTKAGSYSFQNYGTFAGIRLDVTYRNEGYFYFANNSFVCSDNLKASAGNKVFIAPFRTFFTSEAQTESGAKMSGFDIIFGEGLGDTPTGINDVTSRIDTGIKGGKGTITIMSAIDNNVKIYNTSGMHFMDVNMQAGETKTVNVPAGIYVVNGVKIIVK